jgi:hypothetical protein
MPKKTDPPLSQKDQSRRFEEAARAIEADGGLSPTDADDVFERLVKRAKGAPRSATP